MGHYASEMNPYWSESIDRMEERVKLRSKVSKMPLSKFTVADLPMLENINNCRSLWREQEKRLKELGIE